MRRIVLFILLAIPFSAVQAADLSRIFSKVDPSVVVITTKESFAVNSKEGIKQINTGGLGSGVIISADGLIMTAAHVVDSADELKVQLADERIFDAHVVSSSPLADVALIRLNSPPKDLKAVKPADSDKVKVGAEVFVIGAPYGLEHTLTVGYLSGRRITTGEDSLIDLEFLQTDAAVNQGNSGGPLFTSSGKLIGIVSHIRSQSGGNEGLGFAASINMAKRLMLDEGPFWFGVQYISLRDKLAPAFNITYKEGLLVQRVAKGSLGAALKLRGGNISAEIDQTPVVLGGDIIVEVGGNTVYGTRAGRQRIFDYAHSIPEGGTIEMTVVRGGKKVQLKAIVPKH